MTAFDLAFFFFLGSVLFKVASDFIAHEKQMTAEANAKRPAQVRRANVSAQTIHSINRTAGAPKAINTSLHPAAPSSVASSAARTTKSAKAVKNAI